MHVGKNLGIMTSLKNLLQKEIHLAPAVLPNDYVACIVYDQSETLLFPGILPKD